LSNVVPCCKKCNYAKHTSTNKEWQDWIDRLIAYQLALKMSIANTASSVSAEVEAK
jgi:hypothetical protein